MKNRWACFIIAGCLLLSCTSCSYDQLFMSTQPTILALSRETPSQVNPNIGYLNNVVLPEEDQFYYSGHLSNSTGFDRHELVFPQKGIRFLSLSVRNNMAREVYLYIDQRRGPTVQPGEWGQMTVPIGAVSSYYRFCVNAKDGGEDLDIDFKIEQW